MTTHITAFEPNLALLLPETWDLLRTGRLVLHDAVYAVTLHGSHGLKEGHTAGSDIDLSLLVDPAASRGPTRSQNAERASVLAIAVVGKVMAELAAAIDWQRLSEVGG